MPASITHIYYAYKVKDILQVSDFSKFLVGNLFPDIRAIAPDLYRVTHPKDVSFARLFNISNDFIKGWLFHSWLDHIHLNTILKNKELFPNGFCRPCASAYKFRQDLVIVIKGGLNAAQLESVIRAFKTTHKEEFRFVENKSIIITWHKILINYFTNVLNKNYGYALLKFFEDIGMRPDTVNRFVTHYSNFVRFPEAKFLTKPIDRFLRQHQA